MPNAEACAHVSLIETVRPSSPDSCLGCVVLGHSWVHLRICLICGHVGCCDESKYRHATLHFHETSHPVIQSYERGEAWRYCYIDDIELPPGEPLR